ncbi:MAG TPA: hypothetical protein VFH90_02475 [Candidatus Limnocylindria bacterium]|nr:hypothetical protein [Candidatus Limnocylindria bacterium]
MQATLPGGWPRLARLVLAAGLVFLAAVALAAVLHGASLTGDLLRAFPRRMGTGGSIAVLATLAGMAVALVAGAIAARSRLGNRAVLGLGLAAIVVIRGVVVLLMDAPLPNDGLAYQELARWLADGNCCFADRPTGYPAALAALYWLAGDRTWVHEAVNVAAAVAGGWLLWDLVRGLSGRTAAAIALFAFGALPTQVLLTPVLLTDVLYTTLLIGLCWVGVRLASGGLWPAVAAGCLLAVTQYVRPVGPALLPALGLVPLIWVRPLRRAVLVVAVVALAFGAFMTPVVVHNLAAHGDLSVSTSAYGGWSLYMGTNQETNGRYNDADAATIQALPGETLWDRSEAAGRLGAERITSDPAGFAGLTVRKFRVMWGTEEYGVIFGFRPDGRASGAMAGLDLANQVVYIALLLSAVAALALLLRSRQLPSPLLVLVIGLLLSEALVHTFLEVKPRYHAHTLPLMLLLASPLLALAGSAERWSAGWPWQAIGGPRSGEGQPAGGSASHAERGSGGWMRRAAIVALFLLLPLVTLEAGVRALIGVWHLPVARAHSRDFEISWMNLERLGRVDVLILGDSVAQQGILPDAIAERLRSDLGRPITVFNAASASGTFGVNLAIARRLAAEDRLPPVVIVGVQPGILRDDATLDIFMRTPMGQLFNDCYDVGGLEATLGCRFGEVSASWRWRGHLDTVLPAVVREARRMSERDGLTLRRDGFREGFGLSNAEIAAQLPQHLANRDDEFRMGADARERYLELIGFLRSRGTQVVPVAVPEAPPLAEALEARHPGWDAEWHAALADLASASGLAIADPGSFGDWYGEGSMRNIKHLSLAGARDFTGQLLDMPAVSEPMVGALQAEEGG